MVVAGFGVLDVGIVIGNLDGESTETVVSMRVEVPASWLDPECWDWVTGLLLFVAHLSTARLAAPVAETCGTDMCPSELELLMVTCLGEG